MSPQDGLTETEQFPAGNAAGRFHPLPIVCRPRGPSVPPPNTVSESPYTHTQVQSEGMDSGPQAVPERLRERIPKSWEHKGRTNPPPHFAPEGREKGDLTNPEGPDSARSPPGAPSVGVEGSQAENTAPSPSLRSEPSEGLKAQHPVPVRTPDPRPPDSPSVPRKLVLYLKPQPQPRPHPSPPPRSSGTGYQGLDPN